MSLTHRLFKRERVGVSSRKGGKARTAEPTANREVIEYLCCIPFCKLRVALAAAPQSEALAVMIPVAVARHVTLYRYLPKGQILFL
jgi:hypothetical protein